MSYKIRVNCTCGKVLKIPQKYAGKRGKCPGCGKKIDIPQMEDIEKKTAKEPEPEMLNCPTCGVFINPGDKVCISCRTNLSTGDWDAEGGNVQTPEEKKFQPTSIFVFLIALVLGGTMFFLISLFIERGKIPSNSSVIKTQLAKNKIKPKNKRKKPIPPKKIKEKPQQNKPKIPVKPIKIKKVDRVEAEAKEELQITLAEKNAMQRWLKLKEVEARYSTTKYIRKNMTKELSTTQTVMVDIMRKEIETAKELLKQKKNEELIGKSINLYHQALKYGYAEARDFQDQLDVYTDLCRRASNISQETSTSVIDEIALKNLKKKYYDEVLPKWWKLFEAGKFVKACEYLKPVADQARILRKKYPQDDLLHKIIISYEEAGRIKQLNDLVIGTLRKLKGKNFTFFLRREAAKKLNLEAVILGKLTKVEKNFVFVKRRHRVIQFPIGFIKAKHLGHLIQRYNEQDGFLFLSLASYYYITKLPHDCLDACRKAIEKRIPEANVKKYSEWANGYISEMKQSKEAKKKEALEAEEKVHELRRVVDRERQKKKARALIRRILKAYKERNDLQALKYLEKLKSALLRHRDELIKLNKRVKKKQGKSLSTICEECYLQCTRCKGTAWIKCPKCLGAGTIQPDSRMVGTISVSRKAKPCPLCEQKGEVRCPACRQKRDNRSYKMLVEYYKDL